MKTLILSALLPVVLCASTGQWEKTDGTIIEVPCPESYDTNRQRLPAGCSNLKPGIWLSVDKYRAMEVDIAEQKVIINAKQAQIDILKSKVGELQGRLLLCTAVPECPACTDNYFKHTVTGAAIGSVLSLGGCAVWSLSQ